MDAPARPIEGQSPPAINESAWVRHLPDSLGYVVRHKVLGFALAPGVGVESRADLDGAASWFLSWSLLKTGPTRDATPWSIEYGLSPYVTTYSLRQKYGFRLRDKAGREYRSRYEIEAFQAYALAKGDLTWRFPGGAFEVALLAGPSFVWWEDSLGIFGRKLQLTWGPAASLTAWLPAEFFLRGSYEVFAISRGRAIGSSAYQVASYQVMSLTLGWKFR